MQGGVQHLGVDRLADVTVHAGGEAALSVLVVHIRSHGDDRHLRATRKGPDRGKWESEVVAEADAPLITVETVVRGVRDRSNEAAEPERMSGDAARALIEELRCRTTP